MPDTLLIADDATLVIRAEKDGKLRLSSKSWEDPKVVLPGWRLHICWRNGQVLVQCDIDPNYAAPVPAAPEAYGT